MLTPASTSLTARTALNTNTAAGGDCVVTIAANTDQQWVIDFVGGGYYVAPDVNSSLLITDITNNSVLYKTPVTAAGTLHIVFPQGMWVPKGAGVTVTLEDGSQIKDLSVGYH